jgi:hypothetical protein
MSTLEKEREQARKLGRRINRDARSNPNSPYAGKVVGILRGEVVIVAETVDEVAEALERTLLADTGAGSLDAPFELILSASDCQQYMGLRGSDDVALGGAIVGTYPIYTVQVEIPELTVARRVRMVAVPDTACPAGLDGIACFRFLTSFTYGNFGDRHRFGLEAV